MLVHIEGDAAAAPFVLSPWEQSLVANLFGWKQLDRRGREVRRYREVFLYVPRKNGKALDVDTPIPVPGGWKRMGDLAAGDLVFDHEGRPTRVVKAFPELHDRVCYRVEFSDGTWVIADAEHLWETDSRTDRARLKGRGGIMSPRPAVRTTEDIRRTLTLARNDAVGKVEWNHRVPIAGPLDLPDADLPIDPYVLGVWLGDGDKDCGRITNAEADDELLDHVRRAGTTATIQRKDPRSPARRVLLGSRRGGGEALQTKLRRLGVLHNKHIPAAYLRASARQRMALLQGLMDTDGTASKAGQCELTTVYPVLRDGAMELIRSLGLKPTVATKRATIRGRDCGEKYRIQFFAYSDRPCFRLSRKAARLKPPPPQRTRSGHRQVVAVEPVASRPVRCIAVESPRKLYLAGPGMVPTHNTPLCAGIALFVFFCDDEVGQQDFLAAKDKDQAGLLFRQMEGMVEKNPELAARCRVYGGNAPAGKTKSFVKDDNSFLKVISADASGKHGGTSHLVIIDELHEQDDRALFDALRTSFTSENRKQPLFIQLTTADYDRPSICNERYENAKKVKADPARDPRLLPVIYEADPAEPWDAEATWERCNPNLDVSVSRDELRRMANEAKDNPAFLIEFRRLHTNVRMQQSATKAIDLQLWDACRRPAPPESDLAGRPCWAGLDLGWRDDFAALFRLWELDRDDGAPEADADGNPLPRPVWARWTFWVPQGTRRDLRASPFNEFVAGGHLRVTPGNSTDFSAIRAELEDTRSRYDLRVVCFDPSYARSESDELAAAGFNLLEFGQTHKNYSAPWKWLMADGLKGGLLRHDGDPVARWMAGHVVIEVSGTDGVMPKKRKSPEKIDGITAGCMGIAVYLADPNKGGDGGGIEFWD